ncbi:MAG: diguanylate cyclase [Methylomonas sp.]
MLFSNYLPLLIICGWAGLASAAAAAQDNSLDFQLRGRHHMQFAGYYAALEQGYYQEEGLNVRILAGDAEHRPVTEVLAGRAQYAVADSEVVYEKLSGQPLLALAAIFQRSSAVLLAGDQAGIETLQDLQGKKIMAPDGPGNTELRAMFLNAGVPAGQIRITPGGYDPDDIIGGKADAYGVSLANQSCLPVTTGVSLKVFAPLRYGVDFYSDILFTSESELQQHAQRVEQFRRASLKGWRYALAHPDEMSDLLINKYRVADSPEQLQCQTEQMLQLVLPELIEIGRINPDRLQAMADALVKLGLVETGSGLDGFIYDDPSRLPDWLMPVTAGSVFVILLCLAVAVYSISMNQNLVIVRADLRAKNDRLQQEVEELRALETNLRQSEMQYQNLAHIDYLTGLSNRRFFMEQAEAEFTRILRYGGMVSLLMLDLDHFKVINDKYGHQSGDRVLQLFSSVCKSALRDVDVIGRLGGEEFAILLPETAVKEAYEVAERIRLLLAGASVKLDDNIDIRFTVSIGVASLSGASVNLNKLFIEADQALYRAKAEGRNRVCQALV